MKKEYRYYMGDAYDTSIKDDVEILILATDEAKAKKRYEECVVRHANLKKKGRPEIAEFGGDWELVDRCQTDETKQELDRYFSVPVYI